MSMNFNQLTRLFWMYSIRSMVVTFLNANEVKVKNIYNEATLCPANI